MASLAIIAFSACKAALLNPAALIAALKRKKNTDTVGRARVDVCHEITVKCIVLM